jgi:hypothetical protein
MDAVDKETYDRFLVALRALCTEYGVQLSVSMFDTVGVYPLQEGEDPIDGIENSPP